MQYRNGKRDLDESPVNEKAGHPDLRALAAYRDGDLSEASEEEIQRHIVRCEDCVDLLLLEAEERDDERPGSLDFEKEMIWARIKAERAGESEATAWRRGRAGLFSIAAAALLALAPLGWFNLHQKGVIEDLTRPQLNVSIHDLLDDNQRSADLRIDASEPMDFEIPKGTEYYTVIFPVDVRENGSYRVDLLDSSSALIWRGHDLDVDEYGYATLGLSRRFLDQGAYRIRIYDEVTDQDVGDHSFVVRYQ